MQIRFIIAAILIGLSFLYDVYDFKPYLYTISVLVIQINVYNTFPQFSFLESMLLTHIQVFIKAVCIELIIFDKFHFSDAKAMKFVGQVFLQCLIFGNPWIIRKIANFLKQFSNTSFILSLLDKVAQSILLSICYKHLIRQEKASILYISSITLFMGLLTTTCMFLGLLEHITIKESIQKIKSNISTYLIMYLSAMLLVILYEEFGINKEERAINIIVVNTFIVIYTLMDSLHHKSHTKIKQE